MKYPDNNPPTAYAIPGIDPNFNWQSSEFVFHWLVEAVVVSSLVLGIALARMAKASNATLGRCTTPMNNTIRSRKDDLPSEVTELGSVVS